MQSVYVYEPFFSYDDLYRLSDGAWACRNVASEKREQRQQDPQDKNPACGSQPRMDIHESSESNLVTASIELPGLSKSDISFEVQNNRIVVSGEHTVPKEATEKGFIHRERQFGKFLRTIPLPAGIKHEEIKASMENGVLTITFPKIAPQVAPQRISIA